jgi:PAS domain S-box-containing protein
MTDPEGDLQSQIARLRQRNTNLAVYREISERLLGATTMEEVARIAVATLAELFGAEGGALLLAGQPTGAHWEYGVPGAAWASVPEAARRALPAVSSEGPLAEPDAAAFLARKGLPAAPSLQNLLVLPVDLGAERLGALVAYNFLFPDRLPRYAEDARDLLSPIAQAMARVRLVEARDRQARLLETIVENTESQLAYLDRDFHFVQVNSAYERGCGHAREELIGRDHFDLFPNAENQAIFARVRDTGEPVEFRERPFQFADQPQRGVTYWDWTLNPIKNEAGEVEGLVLSLTDMTEQVRTRQRLLAAERARAALAETIASEVNHRMKNNLSMLAGLLEMQISDEPERDPAETIRGAITRIRSLAAVHEELYETRDGNVELLGSLRRIAEIGRQARREGEVEVAVSGDRALYPSKIATPICMIANELVTNAIKHGAPEPSGRLQVRLHLTLREGKLRLSVWNSGNPVPDGYSPGREKTMGLRLVHYLATRDYGGSFTMQAHQGGTLAEIVLDDKRLRELA